MSRDLSAIQLYVKAVLSAEPWLVDARCMPIPFKETTLEPAKTRVGVVREVSLVLAAISAGSGAC